MSPRGPVPVFKSEYWTTEETDSDNGVYEVAETARGTFAETGIVHDVRTGHDDPIEGATVTYETVAGPGLSAPLGGPVQVTTKTCYAGAYAFIDMPIARGGTCYRLVIVAPSAGRYESIDLVDPGVYDHSGLELDGRSHKEPYPYPARRRWMPPVARACAAQGPR